MQRTGITVYRKVYHTPIGAIAITASETAITGICTAETSADEQTAVCIETGLMKKAYSELMEYFSGKRHTFDLPLHLEGTDFQMQVWKALQDIPYGKTCAYKDIAIKTGRPSACRAVGGACHNNPILIMIPCHRVLGTNGALTGYGGGISLKKLLLALESSEISEITDHTAI